MKISIIGAGSAFTKNLVVDILNIPDMDQGTFALVDIDVNRLDIAHQLVEKIIQELNEDWDVISSTNRREIIEDSAFVINQIEVAGLQTVKNEFEIPLEYGVKQCIGDTLGPGGLFKTLRTLPEWMRIVKDIEELSPNTIILNYTNPMSAVTLMTKRITDIPVVGLCHSIQNTSRQLSDYLQIPYDELEWQAAGINHMSWFVELSHQGTDMYSLLKEKIKDQELLTKDPVRFDAMQYLGYFVSESSGHFSEYVPYYRKRDDLIENHCNTGYNGATGFYANNWPKWRKENDEEILDILSGRKNLNTKTSHEYAAVIIEGIVKNIPKVIYGSVQNTGLIDNLPFDGIVEVACLVDGNGIHPCHFGRLPVHLASLCQSNMAFFELAVSAVLNRDREMAMRALMMDPLSSAVCSLEAIKNMFDELYETEKEFINI